MSVSWPVAGSEAAGSTTSRTNERGRSLPDIANPAYLATPTGDGSNGQRAITGPTSPFTMPLSHSGLCINRVSFQVNDIFFIYFQIDQVIHSPPSQVSGLITHPPPPAPQAPVDKCPAETGVESLTAPLANTEPAR